MTLLRKYLVVAMLLIGWGAHPAFADSLGSAAGGTRANQSSLSGCTYNSSLPTLSNGQQVGSQCDVNGKAIVSGSLTPSGTQDVNIAQVVGATAQTGHGTAAGTLRVELPTDGTGVVGQVTLVPTVSTITNPVGIKGGDGSTINGVANATYVQPGTGAVFPVNSSATATSTGLLDVECTVACASKIVTGAHNLYGFSGSATLTGWFLVYDATSCAVDGTVTPVRAYAYTIANSSLGVSWGNIAKPFATGIAICFSTTGPYVATASTTAFVGIDYK